MMRWRFYITKQQDTSSTMLFYKSSSFIAQTNLLISRDEMLGAKYFYILLKLREIKVSDVEEYHSHITLLYFLNFV